jgi:uncharacterized lipoprotein YbaY
MALLAQFMAGGWIDGVGTDACWAAEQMITGTATYRERIALPPNAVFVAIFEETSWADAPAREIRSHQD